MSNISKLTIEGIEYDIKDETARTDIENIREELMGTSAMADEILDVLDGISSEDKIEAIIDNSGVLDSTEGTVKEKVEQLIDKAEIEKVLYEISGMWTTQFDTKLFAGARIIPKLNFENAVRTRTTFNSCLAERIDYYINSGKSTDNNRMCQDCKSLNFFYGIDMSNVSNCSYCFNGCILLETIQEPLNFSKVTTNAGCFQKCNSLINIKFVPETIKISITIPSPVLSAESIQSIFDGLATVSTAQTLTLNANLKILQSQVDSANAKGWTVAGGTVVSEEEYYG